MNFETRAIFTEAVQTTGGVYTGKVTSFSPDKLCVSVKAEGPVTEADLKKMSITANLKNSKGANSVVIASVPCDILASISDFEAGWGVNTADTEGSFFVDLGNLCLEGADELTILMNIDGGLSQAYNIALFAIDSVYGPEVISFTQYIKGRETSNYVLPNASKVYMKLSAPASDTATLEVTTDYFGASSIKEREVVAIGAVMAHSGNFDNFGVAWVDVTGLTQNIAVKCATDNERFAVTGRIFDTDRIGRGQKSLDDMSNYESYLINHDNAKARCLGLIG